MDTKNYNGEMVSRIKMIMSHFGLNQKGLADILGTKQPNISTILSGKRTCDEGMVNKFVISLDINKKWLLSGEGEMLKSNIASQPESKNEDMEEYYTYKLPLSAMGGELIQFDTEGINSRDCERIISPVKGVDMAIPILGDSMAPEYPSGCTVFVKKIDPSAFINWGNVFVLDTVNGTILKVVDPSERDGFITCSSLNPSGRYKPFEVPLRSVRAMYRVVASISMK